MADRHEDDRVRRVWHLRATNFVGGPEKQILGHLSRLDGTAWRASLVLFGGDRGAPTFAERARSLGIETVTLPGRGSFDPRQLLALRRALRRERVDLLVTHGYRADIVGAAATWRAATAQLVFIRGFTAEDAHVRRFEALQRQVVRRADAVACVSEATAEAIVRDGVDEQRVCAIRNAVDVPPAGPAGAPSPPLVVAAGRLSPEKGHELLLEAFARLEDRSARLAIYGEGVLRDTLERRAAALGLADRVAFPGFVTDLPARLAGASLLVNPSTTEGLPNIVLEALSVGTPVVATAVGGVPELLRDAGGGRLVEPGDVAGLAEAIARTLAALPESRREALAARERVRRDYSFDAQTGRLLRLYDAVARVA